ncbi:hypothetical protein SRS16CHR_04851 [Variovorax sp. SRS16]|nr:hypothetical protein SRS16CHR_04851 [Variovorax sp. SRS16]
MGWDKGCCVPRPRGPTGSAHGVHVMIVIVRMIEFMHYRTRRCSRPFAFDFAGLSPPSTMNMPPTVIIRLSLRSPNLVTTIAPMDGSKKKGGSGSRSPERAVGGQIEAQAQAIVGGVDDEEGDCWTRAESGPLKSDPVPRGSCQPIWHLPRRLRADRHGPRDRSCLRLMQRWSPGLPGRPRAESRCCGGPCSALVEAAARVIGFVAAFNERYLDRLALVAPAIKAPIAG